MNRDACQGMLDTNKRPSKEGSLLSRLVIRDPAKAIEGMTKRTNHVNIKTDMHQLILILTPQSLDVNSNFDGNRKYTFL